MDMGLYFVIYLSFHKCTGFFSSFLGIDSAFLHKTKINPRF